MGQNTEGVTPQNPVAEEVLEAIDENSISSEELAELRRNAESSSQNYARLKKLEEENKILKDLQADEVLPEVDLEEESNLKSEVSDLKQRLNKSDLIVKHPEMGEVWDEFETFRDDPENKGMNMNTAAKAFRIEKGLANPARKGLEKQTGGDRIHISTNNKMTSEDAHKLRTTNYEKYREMLKKGQINV